MLCDLSIATIITLHKLRKKKTMYKKIKDGNSSIKSTWQMKARIDTTQRKNESKKSTKNKEKKTLNK
jgi:hypothetical protein